LFYREITHKQKIIITDGLPSSGKSLVCNIISSFPNIDPWILSHYIEHVVALNNLGILKNEISEYLIKTSHNVIFHDNLLLRNVNFRKSDVSSFQKNPKFKIFKQRLNPNETKVIQKNKNKVIPHYCLHFTTIAKKTLFQTFKNKLLFIQVHRSPVTLSMINKIANWTTNISNSKSRDGHIKLYDKNLKKNIPYFIKEKKSEYFQANKYEKAIMIIKKNFDIKKINNKNLRKYKTSEIIIPFENLLDNPKKYLKKIEKYTNSKVDRFVHKALQKNNLPRKFNLDKEKLLTFRFLKKKIRSKYYNILINLDKSYTKNILNKF